MGKWVLMVVLVLFMALAGPATPATAQSNADLFPLLFPELRTLPPPAWLQPGVRLTYQASSATIGGGVSGGGIVEYNVTAVDATAGWVVVNTYGDNGAGALVPLATTALSGLPAVGEFWINPVVLVNAEAVAGPNLSITRLNKTVGNATVTVVRFQSTVTNGETVWEFDAASGVLIFYRESVTNPSTGLTSLAQSTFAGLRRPALPWQPVQAPNWVRPGATLLYSGSQDTTVNGAGTGSLPLQLAAQIDQATRTWSLLTVATVLAGANQGSAPAVTGVGQLGEGYWLPRSALAVNVPTPVVIDTDPVTGIQTILGRAANGDLVVTKRNQAFETILVYNAALGSLDSLQQTIVYPISVVQTRLNRSGGSDLSALNQLPPLPDTPQTSMFLPMLVR